MPSKKPHGNRGDDPGGGRQRSKSTENMAEKPVRLGARVEVIGKDVKGKVAYAGTTLFSSGKWIGVILDDPKGKNNGTVQGRNYFQCEDNHGIFVRQSQLKILDDDGDILSKRSSISSSASTSFTEKLTTSFEGKSILQVEEPSKRHSMRFSPNSANNPIASFLPPPSSTIQNEPLSPELTTPELVSPEAVASLNIPTTFTQNQNSEEVECLKAEVKDLQEKLETLKIKRAEDKTKLKEWEKTKIQLQQMQEFKSKITESQADLQKQLAQAKKEAKDAIEARDLHQEEMSDLAETVEMATLDKEMAEEKCEVLQTELEQMKERVEELSLDLEILRNEISEKGTEGVGANLQAKQLEQQNERLKEALVKMRDLAANEKQELLKTQKELDKQRSEILELSRTKEKLSSQVEEYEKQISELKEQVDAALGAEEMVENLTDRNLTLEENNRELQEIVEDLEKLQDINDQLQESARETELELREEVDMANMKVLESFRKIEALQEAVADYEGTIQKYRELTEQLKEANQELRTQMQKETDRVAMATPAEPFDFNVKFAETKAFARTIEMEIRKLESQQAVLHIGFLCSFMPDNFLARGGDHDAIQVLLLVPRMVAKANILIGQVKQRFKPPDEMSFENVLKSHHIDQYTYSLRLLYDLSMLQSLLHQFNSILSRCSVELFTKMGTLYPEIAIQERAVDFYVDLLKRDQLDETVPLDNLEKSVAYFQSLNSVHLYSEPPDCTHLLSDYTKLLGAACDSVRTDFNAVLTLLSPDAKATETGKLIADLLQKSENIHQLVKKIRRRIPQEGGPTILNFSTELQENLVDCGTDLSRIARSAAVLRTSSTKQVTMNSAEGAGPPLLSADKLKELLHEATDRAYGKDDDDQGPESLKQSMETSLQTMNKFSTSMQEGEFDEDARKQTRTPAPVHLRAQAVKSEARDLEQLRFKLESRESDLLELKRALKLRGEELSETQVRKEMAEKKLELAVRDGDDRVERIQRQLDEAKMLLKNKEKEFEITLDQLQADIDALELEKGELKEKVIVMSKKTLEGITNKGRVGTPGSPQITASMMTSGFGSSVLASSTPIVASTSPVVLPVGRDALTESLMDQVNAQRTALKQLKNENYTLKSRLMGNRLDTMKPLNLPKKPTGLASSTGLGICNPFSSANLEVTDIGRLAKRTSNLLNEIHSQSCFPTVVDITKRKPGIEPVNDTSAPVNQLAKQTAKYLHLKSETEKLSQEVAKFVASSKLGAQVEADFTKFCTPTFAKNWNAKDMGLENVGSIQIPRNSNTSSSSTEIPLIVNAKQLREIHNAFIFNQ